MPGKWTLTPFFDYNYSYTYDYSAGSGCFTADTPVMMADGSEKGKMGSESNFVN